MDISSPANRVLIFGSYFSVSCRQASRPSLSCQEHGIESCTLAIHEYHPVELCRRGPIVIVNVHGVRGRRCAFATLSNSFCRCGIAAPAYPLNTVLQYRHASCAPEKSLGFLSKRVSTPTPVACVPRSGAPRTSCLSAASSFAACCLLQLILQFHVLPGQPLQRSRELLMHCSHGVFCPLGVSGTRCLTRVHQAARFPTQKRSTVTPAPPP